MALVQEMGEDEVGQEGPMCIVAFADNHSAYRYMAESLGEMLMEGSVLCYATDFSWKTHSEVMGTRSMHVSFEPSIHRHDDGALYAYMNPYSSDPDPRVTCDCSDQEDVHGNKRCMGHRDGWVPREAEAGSRPALKEQLRAEVAASLADPEEQAALREEFEGWKDATS